MDSADVDPAGPAAAGIGWLLDEMRRENSPLRRVAGRKALLEYDIAPAGSGPHPEPGIFLYPAEGVLKGDQSEARFRDLAVLVDGVVSAAGWASDAAEREQVERLYRATDPNLGVRAVGAFPSRARGLRVAVTGFRKTAELTAFLERAGWPGRVERLAATVSRLEERGAYGYLGLHFDVRRDGLGSKLGLSFFHQQGEWLRDFRPWEILVEELRRESLAVPEKLSALSSSCCGAEALFGKSGIVRPAARNSPPEAGDHRGHHRGGQGLHLLADALRAAPAWNSRDQPPRRRRTMRGRHPGSPGIREIGSPRPGSR